MNVFIIIFLTLLIYSGIATIIYLIFNKEDIIFWFGLGIVGVFLATVITIIRRSIKFFKYELGKRSIFQEIITGKKYKCKTKERQRYIFEIDGYDMVIRFAKKAEWKDIPDFPLEIRKRKINYNLGSEESE